MSKSIVQINDYVSLAVMLLMIVALVAGQAGASDYATEKVLTIAPLAVLDDRLDIDFNGSFGEQALKISISVISDNNHFRGEDE
jgi:hypothetical protein